MSRRNLILSGACLVIALILFLLFRAKPQAQGERASVTDPNSVELTADAQRNAGLLTAEAEERAIQKVVKATGTVGPDQGRVGHVFPLARGIVEKVYVQLGDSVRQGQPLVTYDNIELGQMIGEYLKLQGELERLEAQQQVAKKSLDRAQALIEVQGIAQREFELRKAEYDQAAAAVQSQRADIARVEEQIHRFGLTDADIGKLGGSEHGSHRTASHNVLTAPLSGVIVKFDVSPGEVVDRDKEVFTIVDTSTVWVLADLYEKDLGQVGTEVEARIAVASYPGQNFSGKVAYISDFLDPASRTAKVRCVVANPDGRLKLDMFATVEIPARETARALAVPASALQQVESDTVVFVQRDATHFEKRVVRVGQRGEDWVEILSGLQKGERVVANGSFYVKSALLRELIGGEE